MKQREYAVTSANGSHELHCIEWLPDGKPICALQIVHGMIEHISRYNYAASRLCDIGIAVYGHDHVGHGETETDPENLGYIDSHTGADDMINDIEAVRADFVIRNPDLKVFILGHSMGSMCTLKYITLFGDRVSGAIISGPNYAPKLTGAGALFLSKIITLFKGERHRSKLMREMSFGSFNKRFSSENSEYAWISRDEDIQKAHDNDPFCTFSFTVSGFTVLGMLLMYQRGGHFTQIPRRLPILIAAGADDPVGSFGKSPNELYKDLKHAKLDDVALKIYPKDRHEILNELNRNAVIDEIASWISQKL